MKFISRIIYFGSIVFIIVSLLVSLSLKIFPLELSESGYEEVFDELFFIGIPVAIIMTCSKIFFKNVQKSKIRSAIINRLIIAVVVFISFIFYGFISFGANMCTWSTGPTLFVNTKKSCEKIVLREFGCGATDNSPGTLSVFKVTTITPFFIYATEIDTTKIDSNEWVKLRQK
jgi:hypothetical protein